ncbi:MAG: hypothetical protein HY962_05435 [Ignavibacteriae bacterium]|nr:hypothetical protein [Ignavibacteriota bacterium]
MSRSIAILGFLLLLCQAARAAGPGDTTSIDLRGLAAFKPGDDEVWRSKYIDEREDGWNFIPVPGSWERAGYPLLDGFGWYRLRFRIPTALRRDSLLLVMSAVDDADEAYLNGVLVGETGAFPPAPRSEFASLRVYPLPREFREEYNLLAVRVYDMGDSGGIAGSIFRIIRADSLPSVLDEIVDAPFRRSPLFLSNGAAVSALDPVTLQIAWTKPHLFHELENGVPTQSILSACGITVEVRGTRKPLADCEMTEIGYVRNTAIITARFREGFDVSWFHPRATRGRVLAIRVAMRAGAPVTDPGLFATFDRSYWALREFNDEDPLERRRTFVLAWNSCCDELAQRDLADALDAPAVDGHKSWSLEAEIHRWEVILKDALYAPAALRENERRVYETSRAILLSAQVREAGMGEGQIVSAFAPDSRARCQPRDHFAACIALATCGLHTQAAAGLAFVDKADAGEYARFDVYGEEFGVGFPYRITPAWYLGNGTEKRWQRPDHAQLSLDGTALYIEAVEAYRRAIARRETASRALSPAARKSADSAWILPRWRNLSALAADVLLFTRDSATQLLHDGHAPWGEALAHTPSAVTSLHASWALFTAARYAFALGESTKSYLYREASQSILRAIRENIRSAARKQSAAELTPAEVSLFHPLIIDGILLGLFEPNSAEARFALDVVERGFRADDAGLAFNALPDGDAYGRMARPLITLRLARAHAVCGNLPRAEQLFQAATGIAQHNDGLLPELVDPVSESAYGAFPSTAAAAEYLLAAEEIARLRGVR